MNIRFDPIGGKTAEIIEAIMQTDEIASAPALEFKIRLCVEEVVENIVSYAYDSGHGYVIVGVNIEDNVLSISFRDAGVKFNPLAKADPDVTLAAEDRPIGGLGIFLCKQMMDDIRYSYDEGENVLVMYKNLK